MDRDEALKLLAWEVVGVSDVNIVHDDEMLRWGDIRKALQPEAPDPDKTPLEAMREFLGREPCWQFGTGGHVCNKKCTDEPTQLEIDDLVAKYREQCRVYDEWSDRQLRELYELRWKTNEHGGLWI